MEVTCDPGLGLLADSLSLVTQHLQYRKKNRIKMSHGLLILPMPWEGERQSHSKFSSNGGSVITGYASGFGLRYCGI